MKEQNFGIEIELTGITRRDAAKIMAEHFGTTETTRAGHTEATGTMSS